MSVRPLAMMVLLAAFARCGDGAGPPAPVVSVTVTPASANVPLFDTLRLSATARDAQGHIVTGHVVTWNTTALGSVNVSATGLVQAFSRATATITATVEGKTGVATIVATAPPYAIELKPNPASLAVGDTLRLRATLYAADGNPPTDSVLTWRSSDTAIAVVADGLVRGRQPGNVVITAASGRGSGNAAIRINARVASVTITPSDTALNVYDLGSFVTIARGPTGDTLSQFQESCPTGCNFVYPVTAHLSDTNVAHFVGCCTIEALAAGPDTFTATADGVSGRATITVSWLQFSAVSVGGYQACGRNVDGRAYCWDAHHPHQGDRGYGYAQVSVGEDAVCGVTSQGSIRCRGALADPIGAPASNAVEVGRAFLCGVSTSNVVWCAGAGGSGQLGRGIDTGFTQEAAPVTGGHAFAEVSTGTNHACGVASSGEGYCWGSNDGGKLGIGDTSLSHASDPQLVTGSLAFAHISAAVAHTCGVTASGEAYCWGRNESGQLGIGSDSASDAPRLVAGGLTFNSISTGRAHTCAIATGGAAYCWGVGRKLGNGADPSNTPVPVAGGLTFLSLDAGGAIDPSFESTCGATTAGVYCWGSGITGVDGTFETLVPIKVQGQQ